MPSDDFVDVGKSTRVSAKAPDPKNPPTMSDDAYPAVILDQRSMLPDGGICETAEDVFWKCWVPWFERQHKPPPVVSKAPAHVIPYINQSRWVADCPKCNGGMACWDHNPYACCLDCGRMYEVRWQPPTERAAVIRVIAGWPPQNRSWDAHKGETIDALKIQGILMQGLDVEKRNGLIVAANLDVPDELASPQDHLEQLRIAQSKGHG